MMRKVFRMATVLLTDNDIAFAYGSTAPMAKAVGGGGPLSFGWRAREYVSIQLSLAN